MKWLDPLEFPFEVLHNACLQDSDAMDNLLSLVVTSSSDENYGEACWALMAAVSRFMLTADTSLQVSVSATQLLISCVICVICYRSGCHREAKSRGHVVQVVDKIAWRAEELAGAALQQREIERSTAALQRVLYALRQLAVLLEKRESQSAQVHSQNSESCSQMGSAGQRSDDPSEVQHEVGQEPGSTNAQDRRQSHEPERVEDLCRARATFRRAAERILHVQNSCETNEPG